MAENGPTSESSVRNITNNPNATESIVTNSSTTLASTITTNDFITELPFSSEDSIAFISSSTDSSFLLYDNTTDSSVSTTGFDNTNSTGNGTDAPYYYYYDYPEANETINPFLRNDYNWYDYNLNDTVPYDYSQGDSAKGNDSDFMDIWKNIEKPPPILPITFCPRDLNIYFLILPPIFCFGFLILLFAPCVALKWRDDIREMMGLQRKFGSNRGFKTRKEKEDREKAEEEDTRLRRERRSATRKSNDIQYVAYAPSTSEGQNHTYDKKKGVSPNKVKENSLHTKENGVHGAKDKIVFAGSSKLNGVPPADEISCIVIDKRSFNDDDKSNANRQDSNKGGEYLSEIPMRSKRDEVGANQDAQHDNLSTLAATSCPKFTGWNKDLYSNTGGYGSPARKSNSPSRDSPGASEDSSWGMY